MDAKMKRSPKKIDVTGSLAQSTLYIDVDDTIIANCWDRSGFDLRPSVMTQLRVLKELFHVRWLTCWPEDCLQQLFKDLYGQDIWRDTQYENWRQAEKVDAVLKGPVDWYWLEDPLYGTDVLRLRKAGLTHRYIQVNPRGSWAFAEACQKLFVLTGIDAKRLEEVGAKMEWFQKY
jgi:hypothetical protein